VLRSDRPPAPTYVHWPGIAVVRKGMEVPARCSTEHRLERRLGDLRDLADGLEPPPVESPGGRRTDTPEPFDRQWVQKGELPVRRHDQ